MVWKLPSLALATGPGATEAVLQKGWHLGCLSVLVAWPYQGSCRGEGVLQLCLVPLPRSSSWECGYEGGWGRCVWEGGRVQDQSSGLSWREGSKRNAASSHTRWALTGPFWTNSQNTATGGKNFLFQEKLESFQIKKVCLFVFNTFLCLQVTMLSSAFWWLLFVCKLLAPPLWKPWVSSI